MISIHSYRYVHHVSIEMLPRRGGILHVTLSQTLHGNINWLITHLSIMLTAYKIKAAFILVTALCYLQLAGARAPLVVPSDCSLQMGYLPVYALTMDSRQVVVLISRCRLHQSSLYGSVNVSTSRLWWSPTLILSLWGELVEHEMGRISPSELWALHSRKMHLYDSTGHSFSACC